MGIHIMVENIPTKFYDHTFSKTKVMDVVFRSPKSYSFNKANLCQSLPCNNVKTRECKIQDKTRS